MPDGRVVSVEHASIKSVEDVMDEVTAAVE